MRPFPVVVAIALFVALASPIAAEDGKEPLKRLAYLKQAISRFEVRLKDAKQAAQLQEPVLRWNDAVISVLDGIVVVWTDGGRPIATADVWVRADGLTHHVFRSLSGGPLTAQRGDKLVWQPQDRGIEFQSLPDAPQPHAAQVQRLGQMRSLARKFTGHVIDMTSEGGRIELRLMPQPVMRYQAPEAKIIDGGMFFLAKGTNPEVVLLLEAIEVPGGSQWRFAAARMTNRETELRFNEEVVFASPYVPQTHDPKATSFDLVEPGPAWKGDAFEPAQ